MNLRAYILRVSIANLCILVLASTLFPLCDAANHGRAIEGGDKFYKSSTNKLWRKLKSLNLLKKYYTSSSSFGYSDNLDSHGSPSLPLPSFNSLAPQPTSSPSYGAFSPYPSGSNIPSPPVYSPAPSPPQNGVWCVAKPTVPDPIVQVAMDYACGSGADCKPVQPNGPCFQPNTVLAHASYAFHSYWQKTKVGGGTCDFGGTAMLVTVDPSYDKCNFKLS